MKPSVRIPERYLQDCDIAKAQGVTQEYLLNWGIDLTANIKACNAQLLCAREINAGKLIRCKQDD